MAVLPDATGAGYWLVTSVGNVYAFGTPLPRRPRATPSPITSALATPDGGGYWILTADGSVYAYGDAPWLGNATGAGGTDPATAVFAPDDISGYWVVTAGGAVRAFGTAPDLGDMSGAHLNGSIVAATGI